jgi:metallo-beta-lactamase family protein
MRFLILILFWVNIFAVSVTYYGGAEEVDGTMALVQYKNTKVLIDAGAHINGNNDIPFSVKNIDAVIITHAHTDHIGRLLKLYKKGFRGKIYMNSPTAKLSKIMLEMQNRYAKNPLPSIQPVVKMFKITPFYKKTKIKDITFEYLPAKHIPGSASIMIFANKKLLFSGDLGNRIGIFQKLDIKAPKADVLFVETTYGDFIRKNIKGEFKDFQNTISKNINTKIIWIPVFALDRAQKILYETGLLFQKKLIPQNTKVYLLSPTASKITNLYINNPNWIDNKKAILTLENTYFRSSEFLKNRYIKKLKPPVIILSTSGMINAANSLRLLPKLVSRKDVLLLFVGYQSPLSFGGKIQSGKNQIQIYGKNYTVNLKYKTFHIFSAHGDAKDIDCWLSNNKNSKIFLVHGDVNSLNERKNDLISKGFKADIVKINSRYQF